MGAPPTVFDQMSLVAIEISVWGGERQSQLKDLGEERHISGDLPPEKVAKSFSKKVIDTKHLRPFRRFRNQAHEACMAVGTQLKDRSGIYAIPDAELDSLILRLEEIEQEYKEELQRFLGDYASYVDEWIAANAEWGEWIRKSTLSLSEVEKRFSFGFFVTGFAPNKRDDGRMAEKAEELGNTLIKEIAQVAEASWERTLRGRDEAGIRVLGPMKRMRRKLAACRFLNPVADQGIQQIDKLLAKMPKSGAIQGGLYQDLTVLTLRFAKGDLAIPGHVAGNIDQALEEIAGEEVIKELEADAESETGNGEAANTAPAPQPEPKEKPDYSGFLF
ncbi:DUF3150 domain-containing protein [Thiolapillus sp.]|uniref:DUF3150 domain-containing protein n=1 Tax=Thiolapillus sp. TaxID=2017437 RepID=UPI003AF79394